MNLEQTLEYIHGNYWNGGTFGLGRVRQLLDLMGNPQRDLKFIHIAGTNGKGSIPKYAPISFEIELVPKPEE